MVLISISLISDVEHLFMYLLCDFFGKMSIQVLSHLKIGLFGFLLLSCMSSLYISDINLLTDMWFANIFSHSAGCFLILLIVSFAVQKAFSFTQSHLFLPKVTGKTFVKELTP